MQEPGEAPLPVSTLPMFMGWHAHLLCVRICLRIRLNLSEVPEELERRAEPGFQSVLFREDPRTQANQREAKQQGHSYAGSVDTLQAAGSFPGQGSRAPRLEGKKNPRNQDIGGLSAGAAPSCTRGHILCTMKPHTARQPQRSHHSQSTHPLNFQLILLLARKV